MYLMKKDQIHIKNTEWSSQSYEKKNECLFFRQKEMLDMFWERGAISREQHDKSLNDLIEKMGIKVHFDEEGGND